MARRQLSRSNQDSRQSQVKSLPGNSMAHVPQQELGGVAILDADGGDQHGQQQ
jgi:hypothetical protein